MRPAAVLALPILALPTLALVVCAAPTPAGAQAGPSLEEAVRAAADGWVGFAYATREGVEICPRGIRYGGSRWLWSGRWRGRDDGTVGCAPGPAEVELEIRAGSVSRVELLVGRREPRADVDLGEVAADDAARFLLSLVEGGASRSAAEDALLPAFLADVPELWRDLARLARNRTLASDVRQGALFWLGQEAASAATAGIAAVAADEEEEQDVRDAAVFALSQRPAEEGVPILMELARSAEQAETRRTAFFWLAQVEDERVAPFFEEVLLRTRRE